MRPLYSYKCNLSSPLALVLLDGIVEWQVVQIHVKILAELHILADDILTIVRVQNLVIVENPNGHVEKSRIDTGLRADQLRLRVVDLVRDRECHVRILDLSSM